MSKWCSPAERSSRQAWGIGQAFVDQLRGEPQLAGKSVDVYAVNYPASLNFSTAADGVIDASDRVRDMAGRCPTTKMVLGGYSQGPRWPVT